MIETSPAVLLSPAPPRYIPRVSYCASRRSPSARINTMSNNHLKFYIDGAWVDPVKPATIDVINPATEEAYTKISAGSAADVDNAVMAARAAFESFSRTAKAERVALLKK